MTSYSQSLQFQICAKLAGFCRESPSPTAEFERDIGITLAETGTKLFEVVAKPKNWTYVGSATFDLTVDPILHLNVTLKNNQDIVVTKPMVIDMLQTALTKVRGKQAVILTAVGDAKPKLLSIKVGYVNVLQINL